MLKNHKWKLIASSIVILLPAVIGLIMWDKLPALINTHWGADGVADGRSSKLFAAIGIPLILLAFHWLCIFFTAMDPKNKDSNHKVFGVVLWIVPVLSLVVNGVMYAIASGFEFDIMLFPPLVLALMFLVLGNYMPKCKHNNTIGIKIKWTLESEENWNATHRVAGKVWVIGGLVLLASIFLPEKAIIWVMTALLPVMVLIPMVYSYMYYRKQVKAGTALVSTGELSDAGSNKAVKAVSLVAVGVILAFVLVVTLTGNIEVQCGDTAFTIEASYWEDIAVSYTDIDSIDYREDCDAGVRVSGFGSPRLSMGTFQNDEFGYYTRYAYTGCEACIVLNVDGKILIISGADNKSTREIYDNISSRIG